MATGGEHKVFMNGFWKPEEICRSIKSQKSKLTPQMGSPAQSTVDTRKVPYDEMYIASHLPSCLSARSSMSLSPKNYLRGGVRLTLEG